MTAVTLEDYTVNIHVAKHVRSWFYLPIVNVYH